MNKLLFIVSGCLASAITGFIVGRHLPKKANLTVADLMSDEDIKSRLNSIAAEFVVLVKANRELSIKATALLAPVRASDPLLKDATLEEAMLASFTDELVAKANAQCTTKSAALEYLKLVLFAAPPECLAQAFFEGFAEVIASK
ncbi:MAG: hypothetical protein M0P69_06450 [Bacteroidales bacterium]|nr:hypothetical protein [Bacteroidales bacterium]